MFLIVGERTICKSPNSFPNLSTEQESEASAARELDETTYGCQVHMSNCWQLKVKGKTSERRSGLIDECGHISRILRFSVVRDVDF